MFSKLIKFISILAVSLVVIIVVGFWIDDDKESKNLNGATYTSDVESEELEAGKRMVSLGGVSVVADIVDTPELREAGLSGKKSLEKNQGMLFVFEKSGFYGFWMKDMLFSIDIIWIDEKKKVVHIETNVLPTSYPNVFYPANSAKYVLEIASGFVEENKIRLGDEAIF
jgi:hypothetical protein